MGLHSKYLIVHVIDFTIDHFCGSCGSPLSTCYGRLFPCSKIQSCLPCLEGRGVSGRRGGRSGGVPHEHSAGGSSWAYVSEVGELEWLSALSELAVLIMYLVMATYGRYLLVYMLF